LGPFDFSKEKDLDQIPIEILEISEKTVNKKIKKLEKNKPKKEIITKPPVILPKPKPPEFKTEKKEIIKIEKVEKKEEKKIDRLSSILKSIDEMKNKNLEEQKKNVQENNFLEEKLTISELDMIRRQFISCWNIPAGAKDLKNLKVMVKIKLDEEGNVISSELVKTKSLKNTFFRAAAESALRAVRHPSCKKLKVPSRKYEIWKNITLNFDPSLIIK
tara:strand:+ start:554 stop:1204 length:651 start_codon:yes stop_codon:yes gene_type:complete